ncbi:MAG: T9SS type A sorting domain-containing protein [Bacteroidia bacterium]|nr:T9SS type A sorting domain-containing protein [Bacteroidia bacterium]
MKKNIDGVIAFWSSPMGINELNEKKNTEIYPNPNSGEFTISMRGIPGKTLLEVYNIAGQLIYTTPVMGGTNSPIDIGDRAAGEYLYRILSESGKLISKGMFVICK